MGNRSRFLAVSVVWWWLRSEGDRCSQPIRVGGYDCSGQSGGVEMRHHCCIEYIIAILVMDVGRSRNPGVNESEAVLSFCCRAGSVI